MSRTNPSSPPLVVLPSMASTPAITYYAVSPADPPGAFPSVLFASLPEALFWLAERPGWWRVWPIHLSISKLAAPAAVMLCEGSKTVYSEDS